MYDVIVIGGGPAGVTAALRARELGASVALVERGRLGGTCTNDGCVPTRVLARAARLIRDSEQFMDFGLNGERPAIDFERLLTRIQQTVYRIHEKKQLISHLERSGVKVFTNAGQARFVDEHNIRLDDGTALRGEKFILCVGGRARRLAFPGSQFALTHSDIWSLQRLPRTMAIIGGAATGSQLASIFAAFGTQVYMLEIGARLLMVEDELVSQTMEDIFREREIQITTGISGVDRIEKAEDGFDLWYKIQDDLQVLRVEAVVMATGWPGNADGLNLAGANLTSERGYIEVDDHLRTSTPHIFAAGDITGRMMLVQSAGYEARIAAENAVLGPGQRYSHQIVPHGGFTDPEYASVGLTEEQARQLDGGYLAAVVSYGDMDRAVIDGRLQGCCKLIVSEETHRILGAHIVGEQALEIIQLVAAGMASDMWVEQLAELEIAYPTYTAVVGLAARKIVQDLGVMPLSPQWRSLGKAPLAEWERKESWEDSTP
ncbi:MAG TPA: NAD(P)/FAD-dependent oxidoreductase [Anaerolineales bacterium]|jgi:dihydrolipoamide dehydrogenase|nr:NAD(P)/FAD-dependent oxidoreductase [Anaerolineales bacterium]